MPMVVIERFVQGVGVQNGWIVFRWNLCRRFLIVMRSDGLMTVSNISVYSSVMLKISVKLYCGLYSSDLAEVVTEPCEATLKYFVVAMHPSGRVSCWSPFVLIFLLKGCEP